MMRSYAGELLMADIQLGPLPLPSKQNPSDDPSRRRAVRRLPVPDVPRWAAQFVAGDLRALNPILPADARGRWLLPVGAGCSPSARLHALPTTTRGALLRRRGRARLWSSARECSCTAVRSGVPAGCTPLTAAACGRRGKRHKAAGYGSAM